MSERLYCVACGKLSSSPINDIFYICSKDSGKLHFEIRGNPPPNELELTSNGKKFQRKRINSNGIRIIKKEIKDE